MVNDQEPRYRLVDADGNVVGSLFAESDGTLKLQEGTSGNDNELSLTTQGALEVEQIGDGTLLAAGFDGTDADARLANAVAAASGGEKIILEQASYVDNLTTDKDLTLEGVKGREIGTNLDGGDWTFNGDVTVADIQLLNGSLQINGSGSEIRGGFHSSSFVVTVDASEVRIYGIRGLDIRFATDTSDCVVDAATGVQVTDNGNNTVGDIA